jgi:probable phosphoglycerate mutase
MHDLHHVGKTDHVEQPSLWIARHGETEWSANGRHTGTTDVPLTDAGREAAGALADLLADESFGLVVTSPLLRARDTASLAGYPDAKTVDDLREWDYGDYEGITTDEIHESRPGWNVFTDGCPNGEDAAAVGARADRVIELVLDQAGDTLAFAHGHVLRVVAARWLGLPPEDGRLLLLDTATIGILGWERETRVVRRWNAG